MTDAAEYAVVEQENEVAGGHVVGQYGVAVQEDEVADEQVVGATFDHAEALGTVERVPFTRRYLVRRTADGWAEA